MTLLNKYDVVILGAGITGLVAANYLSSAGLKVLVLEQANKVGGCCIPIVREGYYFDVGAHVLCSMRKDGIIQKVLTELDVLSSLSVIEINPTDLVIFPDLKVTFYRNERKTLNELKMKFKSEASNLENFFEFLKLDYTRIYLKTKNVKYSELLNSFFSNTQIIELFKVFLGNIGLPSYEVPAFAGIALLKEYVMDNGYYTKGGINCLPEVLASKIREKGGQVKCLSRVVKLKVLDNKIQTIVLADGTQIETNTVISTISPQYLFNDILDGYENKGIKEKISRMKTSSSVFGVNIALSGSTDKKIIECPIWYCSKYNMDEYLLSISEGNFNHVTDQIFCTASSLYDEALAPKNGVSLSLFINAPFAPIKFWQDNQENIAARLIELASKVIDLTQHRTLFRIITTPYFFSRYTQNFNGAYKGWASNIKQSESDSLGGETEITNLYLAGHWTTMPAGQGGLPQAFYSGKYISRKIIRKFQSCQ